MTLSPIPVNHEMAAQGRFPPCGYPGGEGFVPADPGTFVIIL